MKVGMVSFASMLSEEVRDGGQADEICGDGLERDEPRLPGSPRSDENCV